MWRISPSLLADNGRRGRTWEEDIERLREWSEWEGERMREREGEREIGREAARVREWEGDRARGWEREWVGGRFREAERVGEWEGDLERLRGWASEREMGPEAERVREFASLYTKDQRALLAILFGMKDWVVKKSRLKCWIVTQSGV